MTKASVKRKWLVALVSALLVSRVVSLCPNLLLLVPLTHILSHLFCFIFPVCPVFRVARPIGLRRHEHRKDVDVHIRQLPRFGSANCPSVTLCGCHLSTIRHRLQTDICPSTVMLTCTAGHQRHSQVDTECHFQRTTFRTLIKLFKSIHFLTCFHLWHYQQQS